MKGIAHFVTGVAAASCFPAAVESASHGNSLFLLLGGIFGLLPDTLDFKIARYLSRHDLEVALDPLDPDPKQVGQALVEAVAHAKSGESDICVKLHTIRLSGEAWQSYTVKMDRVAGSITVALGDKVDGGGNRIESVSPSRMCTLKLPCDLVMDYGATVEVGFLEGPTLLFTADDDGVRSQFIHWHRAWSHSIVIALVAGAVLALFLGPLAGAIAFLAMTLHALMDQAGFMGGNLFYPFTRLRKPGAKLTTSGDPIWNFAAVWLSVALVFWNLGGDVSYAAGFVHYMIWIGVVPVGLARLMLR